MPFFFFNFFLKCFLEPDLTNKSYKLKTAVRQFYSLYIFLTLWLLPWSDGVLVSTDISKLRRQRKFAVSNKFSCCSLSNLTSPLTSPGDCIMPVTQKASGTFRYNCVYFTGQLSTFLKAQAVFL